MTDPEQNALPTDAAGWDVQLRAANCSDAERLAFKKWCDQAPVNQRQFDKLQQLLRGLREARDMPEIRSLREAALNAAAPIAEPRRRFNAWGVAATAAVGLVAIGLTTIAVNRPTEPGFDRSSSFATAVGERSTTILKDGTVTILNTNTQLEVVFSDQERRVTLLQGQALFDVVKDPMRPFVVMAGEQRITAIGTVFDVRFEGGDVHVTLVEGVLEVHPDAPLGTDLTGPTTTAPSVRLTAGQQLVTTAIATPVIPMVANADVERATIWRQGRVFFEDAPLSEAVAEMNRYSTTQIVVNDPALDTHRVNGMFRTGQQANFIDALQAYYPLDVRQVAENRILLTAERGR